MRFSLCLWLLAIATLFAWAAVMVAAEAHRGYWFVTA